MTTPVLAPKAASPGGRVAVAAGARVRRLLLSRRLMSEVAQGRARIFGLVVIGLGIGLTLFFTAFGFARYVTKQAAPELIATGTEGILLGLSVALVLSSLGHAAQAFFSARDLWFWDSAPAPAWARFVDRATETALAALPTTLLLGFLAMAGLLAGGGLGIVAVGRAALAIGVTATVPLFVGIALAHVGAAVLPAGRLRRASLLVLGIGIALLLVWFRRARVEKLLSPEGAAELLATARTVTELGPGALPSSLGRAFVMTGDVMGLLGVLGWALALAVVAYVLHRGLFLRARDLAVDESPVGLLRGSSRERLLRLLVRPVSAQLRPVVEKDLLAFVRDPAQWGQLVLLLGVGLLYLVNADALRVGFAAMPEVGAAILPSMHTGLVTFIAAGLAVRFAFPQVGLEGPAVWIVEGSPLPARALLSAKWVASIPVVVAFPALVSLIGGAVLDLEPVLWALTSIATTCIALGTAAFGVGRGARKPLFDAASLSELAIGPGALSTMFLAVVLASVGSFGALIGGIARAATLRVGYELPLLALTVVANLGPAALALIAGLRSLDSGAVAFAQRREEEAARAFIARDASVDVSE